MSERLVDDVRLSGLFPVTDCGIFYHAVLGVRLVQPHMGGSEVVIVDCEGNISSCVVTQAGKKVELLHDGLLQTPLELRERVKQTAIRHGSRVYCTCLPRSKACVIEVLSYYPCQRDRHAIEAHIAETLIK